MPLVECVPNFSEGRDPAVIAAIRDADRRRRRRARARRLQRPVAPSHGHHLRGAAGARGRRGLRRRARSRRTASTSRGTQGEHPRIGATDVVPFIPLDGATMDDCIALARSLGARVWRANSGFPSTCTSAPPPAPGAREPRRRATRRVRGAPRRRIATDPTRAPDFGDATRPPHRRRDRDRRAPLPGGLQRVPRRPASNLAVAKAVAKAVRGSSGGLRHVKAIGLEVDGQAQVSMNLVDIDKTPLHRAFEMVRMEAEAHGVTPTWSEIVGLVPERACFETAARHLQLRELHAAMLVLERQRARGRAAGGESVEAFVASVASPTPAPAAAVAAHAGCARQRHSRRWSRGSPSGGRSTRPWTPR